MRISRVEKMTLLFEFDFSEPLNRCIIQTLCLFTTDGEFPSTSHQLLISLLSMSCCLMQQNSTFCQVDDAPSAHFCGLSVNEDISHLRKAQWFNLRKRNYSEGKQQRMCNCCEFWRVYLEAFPPCCILIQYKLIHQLCLNSPRPQADRSYSTLSQFKPHICCQPITLQWLKKPKTKQDLHVANDRTRRHCWE